jgi:hypothetical protein
MARTPDFDVAAAHRFFAADCFNCAWDLIEKSDRTPADDRLMVALNQASIFHWLNRPDVTDRNLSVGYWQAARIFALIGEPATACRYAQTSLDYSEALGPFFRGYSYEALARAALGAGDAEAAGRFLAEARALAADVADVEDKALLEKDVEALTQQLARRP